MSLASETDGLDTLELDPRYELAELTRALRAHTEQLISSGAWGTPKALREARSLTEPPPSMAPGPLAPAPMKSEFANSQTAPQMAASGPLPQRTSTPKPVTNSERPQPKPVTNSERPQPKPVTNSERPQPPPSIAAAAAAAAQPSAPPAVLSRTLPVVLSPEARATQLDALASSIVGCTQCRLHERRQQTVFARGTGSSGLCFIGEGPGADEDVQGFPFVGAAGQLLDRMIAAMGFARDEVYVCNIVKCRPPDNRKPLPDEMSTCKPYLEQQLEILSPEVIIALGATAVEGLLGVSGGITRLRGTWKLYKGRIAVMPTFHPAYLLRAPTAKHAVWEDMQAVLRHMGRSVPARGKK